MTVPDRLTLQQAHEEPGQRHGEDGLGAEVGQDRGEGGHRPPGRRRQHEDLLPSNAAQDKEHRRTNLRELCIQNTTCSGVSNNTC